MTDSGAFHYSRRHSEKLKSRLVSTECMDTLSRRLTSEEFGVELQCRPAVKQRRSVPLVQTTEKLGCCMKGTRNLSLHCD
ncbi:hypothetical protein BaRGS_00012522, partial [Batillaria attramentaria]